MRLKVGRLGPLIKRDLPIEFGREQLTYYGGLELLRRYFHLIGLNQRLRRGFREHQLSPVIDLLRNYFRIANEVG
jgi:hypothetical protein